MTTGASSITWASLPRSPRRSARIWSASSRRCAKGRRMRIPGGSGRSGRAINACPAPPRAGTVARISPGNRCESSASARWRTITCRAIGSATRRLSCAGGLTMALKRYVHGAEGEFFFQKRAPESRPLWIEVVELKFPSGRTAREVVLRDAAQLVWIINLGCLDLHPHPVRAEDLDHPDE